MLSAALLCLSLNVYHEARGESVQGQLAVALVTLNRAKTLDRVCKEVYRKKQFSWTNASHNLPLHEKKAWMLAKSIAFSAILKKDFTGGATHYHSVKVKPYWSTSGRKVGQWGNHIFYKDIK